MTYQISGTFKGTWKNRESWLKNICNNNNNVWISLNNSVKVYMNKITTKVKQQSNYPNDKLGQRNWVKEIDDVRGNWL